MSHWKRLDAAVSLSVSLAALSPTAAVLWFMLLPQTDCDGRFHADPKLIKVGCCPLLDYIGLADITDALRQYVILGMIEMYEVGGRPYLRVVNVRKFNPPGQLKFQRPEHPVPPDCAEKHDAVATALKHHVRQSVVAVAVKEGGSGGTTPTSPATRSVTDDVEVEAMPPTPLSANREALHLAQRWRGVNGRASTALSSFDKATHAFEITLAAGADAHAIEAAIVANPGRSPLEIRDIVLPRVARTRAAPPQESVEESTRRMEALLNNPEALRRATE